MKLIPIGLIAAICLALAGCGSKPGIVGKWKVDPQLASSSPAGLPAGFMTGFSMTFKYEFKADKTFTGSMSTGTYTLDGDKLAMTTTAMLGQDMAKLGLSAAKPQMTGEVAPDGQSMVLHPPNMTGPMASLANIKMVPDK